MQAQPWQEPTLQRWLEKSFSVPENAYFAAGQFSNELFRPFQESKGTVSIFLKEQVDPYRGPANAQWKVHVAGEGGIDLLKGEYKAAGMKLVIMESSNFLLLQIDPVGPAPGSSDAKRAYLLRLMDTAMKLHTADHHWRFSLPTDMNSCWVDCLLTNDGAPPVRDLQSRHDRADVLIREGVVDFIFYKKIEQKLGFSPDDKWFSPQARAAIIAKTR